MSSTKIKEGLEGIASEVIADVQKEAEIMILQAEENAKEILKLAKDDSDKIYATIMAEAMAKASSEKRKINSKAEVEARNQLLQAKESLLNSTFEKAQMKLNKIVDSDVYHELLIGLIEEASKKIGSKKLVVRINLEDKTWLTQDHLDILSTKLGLDLKLAEEVIPSISGCKVQTVDGKLVYDNTLENRLQQLKPALRLEVGRILFQKEESSNVI